MDPIHERFGVSLSVGSVGEILQQCAANPPGEHRDVMNGWGFNFASLVLKQAAGTPVYDEAIAVLQRFIQEGDADQVLLAATFLPPDRIDADAVQAALARLDGKPESAAAVEQLRRRVGRLASSGELRYQAKLRFEVGKPGWEELIGAFIVFDHDWFWQNREGLLGKDPQAAMLQLDFGIRALRRDEGAAFRDEINARRSALGDAYADKLLSLVDYRLAENELRPEPGVRW